MKKKQLDRPVDEFYALVLLHCGAPTQALVELFYRRCAFRDYSAMAAKKLELDSDTWVIKFTQCVTQCGEAKTRRDQHMGRFFRWHQAALRRIEKAHAAINKSE